MSLESPKKILYSYIGLRLRALREENGLTQAEAAALIEKSHQTYSNYEKAENFITLDCLYTLANHYDISVKRLLPDSDVILDRAHILHLGDADGSFAEDAEPYDPAAMTTTAITNAETAAAFILGIKNPHIRTQILTLLQTLVEQEV